MALRCLQILGVLDNAFIITIFSFIFPYLQATYYDRIESKVFYPKWR